MKPSVAGAAVFSGLAAVVAADALPMDSIPLQCVKVCGPIVELTDICNTSAESRRRALNRRKDVGGDGVKMRSSNVHGQQQHSHGRRSSCGRGGQCGKREDEKRQFSVIRQAPTSFPPELLASLEEPTVAAQPSRINLVIVETESTAPTSTTAPPPPTDPTDADDDDDEDVDGDGDEDDFTTASSTITSTSTVARSTTAVSDEEPTATETVAHAEADGDTEEDWWMPDDLEQQCVCSNKSFDVARLTALCASCVDQSGDDTNNISIIMSTCRFANETYSRDEDRVADGVRVKATKPTMKGSTTEEGGVLMAMNGEEGKGETVVVRYAMIVAGLLAWAVVIV